jgi:hypothetical protein
MADQQDQGIRPANSQPAPVTQIQSQPPAREAGAIPLPSAPAAPVVAAQPPGVLTGSDMLLALLLTALAFLLGSFAANNSDVWMNLASGQRIAEGEWSVGVDPFSFATEATDTRPAVVWVEHGWLYSLLLYLLHNLIGGAGLVILKALAVVGLAWCLLSIPGGRKARFMSVIHVGLALVAIGPQLVLRPMTVSFLFFGLTLLICFRAGALGGAVPKPRLLWWLPVLFWLWANLDVWFIMGPLMLALLWTGTGVSMLLGKPSAVGGTTLGAVLGVGLLACVLNPHHVRVFMLPPELASLAVSVVDLPDFLGAGGRALRNLRWADPDYYQLVSPLSARYWRGTPVSQSVAELVLLVLSFFSFAVSVIAPRRPGAPSIHPGRLLLWSVLLLLSLLQARLIPWFAIATAPLAVLNMVEWPARQANVQAPNWRPALLGRGLAFLVLAVLLFFAWPGWLFTQPGDMQSPRRVAWKMPVDPSLHGAALELAELNKAGQGLRVFNFNPDLANYCAYFAPGVKCYFDTRWQLFPDELAKAAKARMALAVNVPEGWQKTLADAKVSYLALSNFQNRREKESAGQLWRGDAHWLQKYTDGKAVIFAWSGPDKTIAGDFHADLNRRAFGKVPINLRAAKPPELPPEEPSFWSQYWQAAPPPPMAVSEAQLYLQYFHIMAISWRDPYNVADQVTRGFDAAALVPLGASFLYFCANEGVTPGGYTYKDNIPVLKTRDFGPPAAPLLALRAIRRAIAENPRYPRNYQVLAELCDALNRQEEHWTSYRGELNRTLRLRVEVRQIEILTALMTYLDLRPDDAEVQLRVGNMLSQFMHFDAALSHLQQALLHWDDNQPGGDDRQLAAARNRKKALEKRVRELEQIVQKQLDAYGLNAANKKVLDKVLLATRLKLPQKALELLADMKLETLSNEERLAREFWRIPLLLQLGRAGFLTEPITHPNLAQFRAYRAAAVGDYVDLDKAFADMERAQAFNRARETREKTFRYALALTLQTPVLTGRLTHSAQTLILQHVRQTYVTNLVAAEAELRTLRGMMALEYGDTAAARRFLDATLRMAAPDVFFPDRPIAERYLQLLRAQEPRAQEK